MAGPAKSMALGANFPFLGKRYFKSGSQAYVRNRYLRAGKETSKHKKSPPTLSVTGQQPYVSGQKHRPGDVSARAGSDVLTKK